MWQQWIDWDDDKAWYQCRFWTFKPPANNWRFFPSLIWLGRLCSGRGSTSEIYVVSLPHNNSQAPKVQSLFSLYQHIDPCIFYWRKGRLNIANGWLGLGQTNLCHRLQLLALKAPLSSQQDSGAWQCPSKRSCSLPPFDKPVNQRTVMCCTSIPIYFH